MSDNGGPAFPVIHDVPAPPGNERAISVKDGISKLDYFAAAALPRVIEIADREVWAKHGDDWRQQVARECYRFSAAMLAESERRAKE